MKSLILATMLLATTAKAEWTMTAPSTFSPQETVITAFSCATSLGLAGLFAYGAAREAKTHGKLTLPAYGLCVVSGYLILDGAHSFIRVRQDLRGVVVGYKF